MPPEDEVSPAPGGRGRGSAGSGGGGRRGGAGREGGGGRGGAPAERRRQESGEHRRLAGGGRGAAARAHTLKLEVGGLGVELHCDTCELVVTHLAGPEVRRSVEEAHRRHLGTITWESGWFAVCSCGWSSAKIGQERAWQEIADHEAAALRPPARGAAAPGAPPPPPSPSRSA